MMVKLSGYVRWPVSNVLHLFALGDPATGDDDDLVLFVKCDNLCNTVGGTGVVDIAGREKRKKVRHR